jgi:hypothetical protein
MQKAAYEAKGERKSTAAIADAYGETVKTVYRYVKLNELDASLLPYVDEGRLPVMAGVMLTDLKYPHNQKRLADYLKGHDKQKVSLKQAENLLILEKQHDFHSDILSDFFIGKGSPVPKAPEQLPAAKPTVSEEPEIHENNTNIGSAISEQVTDAATYQRMTHERCNGMKTGYWSPNTKEELIDQLAKFENAYPGGPEESKKRTG